MFLKKQKKGMILSWSDDEEGDGDGESESAKHVTAMTGRIVSEFESSDEYLHYKELTVSYNNQEVINADTCKQLEEQRETINHLQKERIGHLTRISELNNKVILLNSQLENVLKQVIMMTTGFDVLDKMLEGQIEGKPNGIGFSHEHLRQEHQNSSYSQSLE
jgi:hypothetical protein